MIGHRLLRPLLDVALALLAAFQHLAQTRQRDVGGGEIYEDEPTGHEVGEVVEQVGVGDAVDGGTDGEEEH